MFDFYAQEREWKPLSKVAAEVASLRDAIRSMLFPRTGRDAVEQLLRERRFVVVQGPPGTGKSRLADEILAHDFHGRGQTVQFHPATSYEDFVVGLSPDVADKSLRFKVRAGLLAEAIQNAQSDEYLLVIDEFNRADLSRVLGEVIYLFEHREIAAGKPRTITLSQTLEGGQRALSIPKGLYVLGTMNSSDRSIAILDLAIRRRFAFVDMWPDFGVVQDQGIELANSAFGKLQDIFVRHAPEDALSLLPGHAYFLADDERQLRRRFAFELLPLLCEYLQDGRLAACEIELAAYIDWLQGELDN